MWSISLLNTEISLCKTVSVEVRRRKEGNQGKGHFKTVTVAFLEKCFNLYRWKMLYCISVDFYNQLKIHGLYIWKDHSETNLSGGKQSNHC